MGTAQISNMHSPSPEQRIFEITCNPKWMRFILEKGYIALNGVSLTINSISDTSKEHSVFSVMIIPHTWTHTNLSQLKPDDFVNIEVDILAKYVERLCRT